MALKPTIYKFRIALTDLNRDYYDSFQLTVAQHPSETLERMSARIVAFCHQAQQDLVFTKGLSSIEEPDIWKKTLTDDIETWIEVGEPDPERIKKASRLANNVFIYSFNRKGAQWWTQNQSKLVPNTTAAFALDCDGVEQLAQSMTRTMDLSVMLTGEDCFIETGSESVQVTLTPLHQ